MSESKSFGEWCLVELMGHRRMFGFVSEATIAGHGFLRVHVPKGTNPDDGWSVEQLVQPSSIYSLTPTTEALARAGAVRCQPTPITRYDLALPEPVPDAIDGPGGVGEDDGLEPFA